MATRIVIPPKRNAPVEPVWDEPTRQEHSVGSSAGRPRWEKESHYSRRSLVEVAVSRYSGLRRWQGEEMCSDARPASRARQSVCVERGSLCCA